MIIGPNRYDDGELLAPCAEEIMKTTYPGGKPTTDAGYCHRFKYESRTQKELDAKNARFFRLMGDVPRFLDAEAAPVRGADPRGVSVRHGHHLYGRDAVYRGPLTPGRAAR